MTAIGIVGQLAVCGIVDDVLGIVVRGPAADEFARRQSPARQRSEDMMREVDPNEGRGYDCAEPARVLRAGRTIKEIVRELYVSRNTVRKVLRSGATEFSYEREVQPRPKLGRWKADLDRIPASNEAKQARERLTLIRVFEELRAYDRTSPR